MTFGSFLAITALDAIVQSYYDHDLAGLTSDSSFYLQAVLGNMIRIFCASFESTDQLCAMRVLNSGHRRNTAKYRITAAANRGKLRSGKKVCGITWFSR